MTDMIEKFNEQLNESVSGDDYNNRWVDYRADITKFVAEHMWSRGDCIILGAGNLKDIDLKVMCETASDITLVDIDRNAVLKGIKKQDIQGSLKVIKNDFGSMDENSVFYNIQTHISNNDESELEKYLDKYKFTDNLEVQNFDNVFVSAIYTQLFIPQLLTIINQQNQLSSEHKKQIVESSLAFTAKLIAHVNELVIRLAADDATVCAWSDVLEYENEDPALNDIKNHIDDRKWMDSMYEIYIRDYGHGLGSYGLSDLTEKLGRVEEKWLIWPFNENRTLVVKIISGAVTS